MPKNLTLLNQVATEHEVVAILSDGHHLVQRCDGEFPLNDIIAIMHRSGKNPESPIVLFKALIALGERGIIQGAFSISNMALIPNGPPKIVYFPLPKS